MQNTLGRSLITRRVTALIFICVFAFSSVCAQGVKKKVRFAKGTSSITIREAVVRGDRDRYYVSAKAGQRMSVKITSLEKTLSFRFIFTARKSLCQKPASKTTLRIGPANCLSTMNT